jgi:hypothetical protein
MVPGGNSDRVSSILRRVPFGRTTSFSLVNRVVMGTPSGGRVVAGDDSSCCSTTAVGVLMTVPAEGQ